MRKIQIADTRDRFVADGKPFFYLADTVWTAFYNPSMEEWAEYLDHRRLQGFNALQINVLTQWDGGLPDTGLYPFAMDAAGKFNFSSINHEYFQRARDMLALAAERGFTPVLVVLWGNYVKDTWMSNRDPSNIMPLELVKPYVEYVVRLFAPFHPIYMAAGDTNFGSPEATKYYLTAMETIKNLTPDALITLHLGGGFESQAQLPEFVLHSSNYDFYLYQSGHEMPDQRYAYKLAEAFRAQPVQRPIVNGEPCYEGHYFGGKYGRFNEFHVRKAIWSSLLSGAKAGVTYGAHGVWGWYRDGKEFYNQSYGGRPLPWRTALRLKGAWDASFARYVFETYGLFALEPCQAVRNDTQEIRMSLSPDQSRVAVYVPYNADVTIGMEMDGYDWTLISLADRYFAQPSVLVENGTTTIRMHDFNSDCLIIGVK